MLSTTFILEVEIVCPAPKMLYTKTSAMVAIECQGSGHRSIAKKEYTGTSKKARHHKS